jgi:Sec-independent protein translocase protein TatA
MISLALPWGLIARVVAVAGLVTALVMGYTHLRESARDQGRAEVRAQWRAQTDRDTVEQAKRAVAQMARNQEKFEAVQVASVATETQLKKELQHAQTARSALVDDLMAGRVRIRPFALEPAAGSAVPAPAASACVDEPALDGLRQRVAQTVALGAACTAERDAAIAEVKARTAAVNKK